MSTYEEAIKSITLDADASLWQYTGIAGQAGSASPNYRRLYSFVKITGDHACGLAIASTDLVVGVTQSKPQKLAAATTVAMIEAGGVSNLIAGVGGWTAGQPLTTDANGHGIVATGGAKILAIGVAATAAGSAGPALLGHY